MKENYKKIHAQTVALYERQSDKWDQERLASTFFEQKWIDTFLRMLPAKGSVLDIGCGGGYPISKHIIEQGFLITGIDGSPTLLGQCRLRYPGNWILADMREIELQQQFNGIIAWDSFFHLNPAEQRNVLRKLCMNLAPNGALLMTVGPEAGEVLGRVGDEQVYHASLSFEEYESILGKHGVKIIVFEKEDPLCGFHTVLLAKAIP